jgi:hypothetical protein
MLGGKITASQIVHNRAEVTLGGLHLNTWQYWLDGTLRMFDVVHPPVSWRLTSQVFLHISETKSPESTFPDSRKFPSSDQRIHVVRAAIQHVGHISGSEKE